MAIYLMGGASLYLSLIIQSVSDNCIMRKETALRAAQIIIMKNSSAEKDERDSEWI